VNLSSGYADPLIHTIPGADDPMCPAPGRLEAPRHTWRMTLGVYSRQRGGLLWRQSGAGLPADPTRSLAFTSIEAILLLGMKYWLFQVDAEDMERLENKVDAIAEKLGRPP
jgi:hypothetical protein